MLSAVILIFNLLCFCNFPLPIARLDFQLPVFCCHVDPNLLIFAIFFCQLPDLPSNCPFSAVILTPICLFLELFVPTALFNFKLPFSAVTLPSYLLIFVIFPCQLPDLVSNCPLSAVFLTCKLLFFLQFSSCNCLI